MKLKKILFTNEADGGGFHGGPKFQGGAYGYGNRYQLAASEMWPGLADPAEDLPNNPSMWPAVHAQEESDKDEYDSLESAEVYDDRPHLLPGEDTVRDQLLAQDDLEPSYFYEPLNERGPSDILYRDLPGFPAMNTLSDPIDHVPEDEDPDREEPEEERYNVPQLLPGGREGERGVPFGRGPLNAPGDLNLQPGDMGTQMDIYSPMEPQGNQLKLTQKRNQTLNRWKETTQVDKGHTNRDEVFNHLVKPVNYIKKSWGQQDYVKDLDSEDDVPLHAGAMGVVAHPVKHVPGPVDIYKKGNPGYSLGETKEPKKMAKNKSESKRELEKYVPEDLDKKMPKETYGNGMGQVMKAYPFPREDRELKKVEPLEPEQSYIPYNYDRSHIDTIIITKLFEKLAKLAKSEKK